VTEVVDSTDSLLDRHRILRLVAIRKDARELQVQLLASRIPYVQQDLFVAHQPFDLLSDNFQS
jgi:hypothetical protein